MSESTRTHAFTKTQKIKTSKHVYTAQMHGVANDIYKNRTTQLDMENYLMLFVHRRPFCEIKPIYDCCALILIRLTVYKLWSAHSKFFWWIIQAQKCHTNEMKIHHQLQLAIHMLIFMSSLGSHYEQAEDKKNVESVYDTTRVCAGIACRYFGVGSECVCVCVWLWALNCVLSRNESLVLISCVVSNETKEAKRTHERCCCRWRSVTLVFFSLKWLSWSSFNVSERAVWLHTAGKLWDWKLVCENAAALCINIGRDDLNFSCKNSFHLHALGMLIGGSRIIT